jgi:hypothetical protein
MDEKIELLRNHLPPFLVEHRKLYSILSLSMHELNEQQCLNYFDVIKHAIVIILNEDKTKKEELAMRDKFSEAIKTFSATVEAKEAKSRSRKSAQGDKWSFCLMAGTLCPANQERP